MENKEAIRETRKIKYRNMENKEAIWETRKSKIQKCGK